MIQDLIGSIYRISQQLVHLTHLDTNLYYYIQGTFLLTRTGGPWFQPPLLHAWYMSHSSHSNLSLSLELNNINLTPIIWIDAPFSTTHASQSSCEEPLTLVTKLQEANDNFFSYPNANSSTSIGVAT